MNILRLSNLEPQISACEIPRQAAAEHDQAGARRQGWRAKTGEAVRRVQRGFTFMELLIVMVIIAILAAVAIPKYLQHLRRAKEVVLQQNIWTMRRAIDFYWQDKEKPPASLQELVTAQYLREVPKDPICHDCAWNEISAPGDSNDPNASGGISDVKSTAPGEDSSGKAYSDY